MKPYPWAFKEEKLKIEGKINVKRMTNLLPNPRLLSSTQAWSAGGINLSVSRRVVIVDRRVPGLASFECILRRKMWSEEPRGWESDEKNSRLKESDYDVIDFVWFGGWCAFSQSSRKPNRKANEGSPIAVLESRERLFSPTISLSLIHHSPRGQLLCYITPLLSSGSTTNLPAHGLPWISSLVVQWPTTSRHIIRTRGLAATSCCPTSSSALYSSARWSEIGTTTPRNTRAHQCTRMLSYSVISTFNPSAEETGTTDTANRVILTLFGIPSGPWLTCGHSFRASSPLLRL